MTQPRRVLDLTKRTYAPSAGTRRPASTIRRPMRYAAAHLEARHVANRARRWKLQALLVPLLFILLVGAAWGVSDASYAPRFAITRVRVEGAEHVPARLVSAYVETQLYDGTRPYISQNTALTYHPEQIAAGVAGFFPRIRTATVTHDTYLANSIIVRIEERHAFARWCPQQHEPVASSTDVSFGCYYMDDEGFIFSKDNVPAQLVTRYTFTGGLDASRGPIGQRYAASHVSGIVALLHDLEDNGFKPISVDVRGKDDFAIDLDDGFLVFASFGQNVHDLTHNLKLVLHSDALATRQGDLEYIDLRFGNRVYYRFRSDTGTVSSSTHQ